MGGDWQELGQSVLLGLIFSFLVAKLFSVVFAFRDENLRVVREEKVALQATGEATDFVPDPASVPAGPSHAAGDGGIRSSAVPEAPNFAGTVESSMDEQDEDDDWEGVETTELDEEFTAATTFIAAAAAGDQSAQKVPTDVQLQLYGYYKIATEGPCRVPQPSALKMSARAKWNAWQRLGTMSPEEAMQNYINIVNELYPTWSAGGSSHHQCKENRGGESSSPGKGPMGPVFSSLVHEEDSDHELKLDAIHISAREGDVDSLLKQLEHGVPVNIKDSDGRTALHWAVDRGHLNAVQLLVSKDSDVNVKDNEGQTPLHYAVLCERQGICEYLVKNGGDLTIVDNDGSTPRSLCTLMWPCMQ
ncbi:acyl-CoA-binding domain-containing protein 1-like [Nymphaea colorata]|nr:acyl-CoA-binding domain-containing protein 1-like [Nymphaea colorata]